MADWQTEGTPLSEISDDLVCRNCHEPGGDLIAPCPCSGSVKWVHRSCLDQWRAVSPNPTSFHTCDICRTPYQMEYEEENPASCYCPRLHFAFLLTRDFLTVAIVITAITTLCSVFIWLADSDRERDKLFDKIGWPNAPHLLIDWFYGWVMFFFVVGLLGILGGMAKLCGWCCCGSGGTPVTYDTYPYGYGWFYCYTPDIYGGGYHHHHGDCCVCCVGCGDCGDCGDCNCGNCNCGDCKGDDGQALIIIAIVVVVLIVLIGIIIGLIYGVYYGITIVRRHLHVLHNRYKAGKWVVKDLANEPISVNV